MITALPPNKYRRFFDASFWIPITLALVIAILLTKLLLLQNRPFRESHTGNALMIALSPIEFHLKNSKFQDSSSLTVSDFNPQMALAIAKKLQVERQNSEVSTRADFHKPQVSHPDLEKGLSVLPR